MSKKRIRRKRLWIKPDIGVRLKPEYKNQVWSYDFMSDRTHDKRIFRILNIMDECARECLCCYVSRRIKSENVIFLLLELFLQSGMPKYIRSDNGPEFVSKKLVSV
ncbi:MAG: DDE-type integrase/transposase/recombinase [Oligoflexia bacterium]|nr:DDE-type integrase/transposase/recombinase [Oligoflexia bacterium]